MAESRLFVGWSYLFEVVGFNPVLVNPPLKTSCTCVQVCVFDQQLIVEWQYPIRKHDMDSGDVVIMQLRR